MEVVLEEVVVVEVVAMLVVVRVQFGVLSNPPQPPDFQVPRQIVSSRWREDILSQVIPIGVFIFPRLPRCHQVARVGQLQPRCMNQKIPSTIDRSDYIVDFSVLLHDGEGPMPLICDLYRLFGCLDRTQIPYQGSYR